MKPDKNLQQKLKLELQELLKKEISESDAWEALFNLSGFFKTLNKMRMEAVSYGNARV